MKVSGLILAGGASRRMGRDKAWLEWEGRSLLARAVDASRQIGIEEVFISGRADVDYTALGCPVLLDVEPGQGPLGGIERGLHRCALPLLFVVAVDLPKMTPVVLRHLLARVEGQVGVVPFRQGEVEPLAAVYPKMCQELARGRLQRGQRSARGFADACLQTGAVRGWPVPPELEFAFTNWNRPEELLALRAGGL